MPRFAIRVTWASGVDEYVKEGRQPARFNSRQAAQEQLEFIRMGLDDDEIQAIVVVPYPATAEVP